MNDCICFLSFKTWMWRWWVTNKVLVWQKKACDIKHSLRLSIGWSQKYIVLILMRVRSSIIHLFYEEHTLMYTVIVLWCWYQQFYSTSMCTRVCKKHRKNTEKIWKKYRKFFGMRRCFYSWHHLQNSIPLLKLVVSFMYSRVYN